MMGLRIIIRHGELIDMQRESQSELVDAQMGDSLEEMVCDFGQESFQQVHVSVYDTLQSDPKKPLYSGCKKSLTLLSMVFKSG